MENPKTWTNMHHKISAAIPAGANEILKVITDAGYQVTISDVDRVINRFNELMQLRFCGSSLESMLVNELCVDINRRY